VLACLPRCDPESYTRMAGGDDASAIAYMFRARIALERLFSRSATIGIEVLLCYSSGGGGGGGGGFGGACTILQCNRHPVRGITRRRS